MELLVKCTHSGATVVIVTHDDAIYRHTRHRVMKLDQGRIAALGVGDGI
jgi:ABC-type ATPase involved in cell division